METLKVGEVLHIATRRLFEDEVRRHFAGAVETLEGPIARISGYAFIYDGVRNEYHRKPERRTRIIALGDSQNIINVLPVGIDLDDLRYDTTAEGRLVLSDGKRYQLDINEFGPAR